MVLYAVGSFPVCCFIGFVAHDEWRYGSLINAAYLQTSLNNFVCDGAAVFILFRSETKVNLN